MMYGDHMGTGGWVFSIFVTLIVFGLILAGFVWIASARTGLLPTDAIGAERDASARAVLERRLASGEITADEHEEVDAKLGGVSPSKADAPIESVGAA
jgi:uncharacterized membrane protein